MYRGRGGPLSKTGRRQFAGQEKVTVWEFPVVLPTKHQFLMTVERAEQRASLVVLVVKNPPANSGDPGSIPGSGRSPEEGNGIPLQYSCQGNAMKRGASWATVHPVTELDTMERLSLITTEEFHSQKSLKLPSDGHLIRRNCSF